MCVFLQFKQMKWHKKLKPSDSESDTVTNIRDLVPFDDSLSRRRKGFYIKTAMITILGSEN
jgi:hypothetical protein